MIEARTVSLNKRVARAKATRDVTRQINQTEAQLDLAGIELFKLGISMLQARAETGISATFGDKPVATTVEAIVGWGEMRARTIAAHKNLLIISEKLGTREIAGGDGGDRPDDDIVAMPGDELAPSVRAA